MSKRIYMDDVEHFLAFGYSGEQIAERLGVKLGSLQHAARRNQREDLAARLQRKRAAA